MSLRPWGEGVTGFADGDLAYGYCFCKHYQRGRVLWTVERTIAKPAATDGTVTALPAEKRQVGFGVAVEGEVRGAEREGRIAQTCSLVDR
jgi:hypothetical protein